MRLLKRAIKFLEGGYYDQFVVDMIQGGAGTSTNMNANEVIANIGLELMGHKKVNTNIFIQMIMLI